MIFISLEFSNRCSSTTLPLSTRGLSLHPPFYLSTERSLTKHTHTQQWGSLSHLLGRSWRCYFSWTPALNFSSVYFTFRCCYSPTIFSWKGKWPNDRRSTPSDLLFFLYSNPSTYYENIFLFQPHWGCLLDNSLSLSPLFFEILNDERGNEKYLMKEKDSHEIFFFLLWRHSPLSFFSLPDVVDASSRAGTNFWKDERIKDVNEMASGDRHCWFIGIIIGKC